jgi:isoleucyl-tRNA synthetase
MVYLPKDKIGQKLDRSILSKLNNDIEAKTQSLYEINDGHFIVQDGEPYANGELHLGHLLNKTLKDILVKHQLINGKKVVFSFGWDCFGLPIENKAKDMDGDLYDNAKNIALKYKNIQKNTLNKFGIFSTTPDFLTMDDDFKEREILLFNTLFENGFIFNKNKPTWYSPTLKTVLANSEIEYKKIADESVYFKLNFKDGKSFLVWTTTEWTVSGNQAICLNKQIEYVLTEASLICSKKYASENKLNFIPFDVSNLETYINHKGDSCRVLFDDYVTDDHTGIVHLCGGHGDDDFRILEKNGITPKNVCDVENILEHIINYKIANEYVYKREAFDHDYPMDWRNGDKVYKVLTNQTYLDFDFAKIKTCLKQIKLSSKDRTRLESMIFSRKDWCLSRQRKWGVKIPNSNDILDVWFDSGSTFQMYDAPADIYIEGSDQHRGWFQSSVILASMIDKVPTKRIFTHGFILDETKEKLSKSKGNGGSLEDLFDKYNPDVLRLWVVLSDFRNDIVFSENALINAGKQYFKIRNYLRFLSNNLYIENYEFKNVSHDIKNKFETFKIAFDIKIENIEYNQAFNLFFKFMLDYSATLSEEKKNEFYEAELNSKVRINTETEFCYLLTEMNKMMFCLLPFLSSEIDNSLKNVRWEN